MARGGVAAICMAAVAALGTVQPIRAILAGKFTFLPVPSRCTRAGPIQGVTGSTVEALAC